MPYVLIQLADNGATSDKEKAELISGATELLVTVLGKSPDSVYVVINDIPLENWGIGYESLAARRFRQQSGSEHG
jgi:4-oxalocrotonate tautomerase